MEVLSRTVSRDSPILKGWDVDRSASIYWLMTNIMEGCCSTGTVSVKGSCRSPWAPDVHLTPPSNMQVVPLRGRAFFWCRPGLDSSASNVTYNVTWIHRHHIRQILMDRTFTPHRVDRIIYEDGRPTAEAESHQNQTDIYTFISQTAKDFIFIIDQITEASVGQVKCLARPSTNTGAPHNPAATYSEEYFLYVKLTPEKMFPRPLNNIAARRGQDLAVFSCDVYFRVELDDPCVRWSQRFRWTHQGRYIVVPKGDPNQRLTLKPYNFGSLQMLPGNTSELVIRGVEKDQQGKVTCEVRWGPEPQDWFIQEAYLSVY